MHNLSALPRREAEALMDPTGRTERLCVAFVPDAEGNPLTLEQCQARGIAPDPCAPSPSFAPSPLQGASPALVPAVPVRSPRWSLAALLAGIAASCATLFTGCASVPPLSQNEPPPSQKPARQMTEYVSSDPNKMIVGDEGIYMELSREPLKKQQTKGARER
ncbi:MAG: hypothetical protein ACAI35_00535 [Candidatus Methylacidiphilales bacterium]|nr:hypothetical protein [Candidatus Methylacidiphilales bacterium]